MSKSQTLYAHWDTFTSFTVPEGIDINDTKKVCWYVRWNTLYIDTKDGRHFEIEADEPPELKRPESCSLYDPNGNTEEDVCFNNYFDDSSSSEEDSDSDEEDEEKEDD